MIAVNCSSCAVSCLWYVVCCALLLLLVRCSLFVVCLMLVDWRLLIVVRLSVI